jgi:hypothetical protein
MAMARSLADFENTSQPCGGLMGSELDGLSLLER